MVLSEPCQGVAQRRPASAPAAPGQERAAAEECPAVSARPSMPPMTLPATSPGRARLDGGHALDRAVADADRLVGVDGLVSPFAQAARANAPARMVARCTVSPCHPPRHAPGSLLDGACGSTGRRHGHWPRSARSACVVGASAVRGVGRDLAGYPGGADPPARLARDFAGSGPIPAAHCPRRSAPPVLGDRHDPDAERRSGSGDPPSALPLRYPLSSAEVRSRTGRWFRAVSMELLRAALTGRAMGRGCPSRLRLGGSMLWLGTALMLVGAVILGPDRGRDPARVAERQPPPAPDGVPSRQHATISARPVACHRSQGSIGTLEAAGGTSRRWRCCVGLAIGSRWCRRAIAWPSPHPRARARARPGAGAREAAARHRPAAPALRGEAARAGGGSGAASRRWRAGVASERYLHRSELGVVLRWTGVPLLLRSHGYPPLSLSNSSIFAVGS